MNKLNFRWAAARSTPAELRIVPVQDGRALCPDSMSAGDRKAVAAWIKSADFEGAVAAVAWPTGLTVPVLLVGIGPQKEFHASRWIRAWAAAGRAWVQSPLLKKAAFAWSADEARPEDPAALAALAADGLLAGLYECEAFRAKTARRTFILEFQGEVLAAPDVRAAVQRSVVQGEVLQDVRDVANLPSNELTPMELARRARRFAKTGGLSCRVWDQTALEKEKCGALLSVARGSREPGCLIRLAYAGSHPARKRKPLVLVGKAVTFDSGGISLKPGKNMSWKKYDKCGGMTVMAAVLLAARLKLPRPVVALIPAVENMPGGRASRPGDIVTARNGKTIEILNTDAEGRLILADALSFAAEEKPAAIVDLATLTGAVIVALGHETAAVMGNDDRLMVQLMLSGEATGERLWQLPLWPEYQEMLKSPFADLQNIGDGSAGTIAGGMFLRNFVPEGIPWAHVDIAGTAWLESKTVCGSPGATLAGARLLTDWIFRFPEDL